MVKFKYDVPSEVQRVNMHVKSTRMGIFGSICIGFGRFLSGYRVAVQVLRDDSIIASTRFFFFFLFLSIEEGSMISRTVTHHELSLLRLKFSNLLFFNYYLGLSLRGIYL